MSRPSLHEYGVRVRATSTEEEDEDDQENGLGRRGESDEEGSRRDRSSQRGRDSEDEAGSVQDDGEASRALLGRLNRLSKEDLVKSLHKSLLNQDSLKDEVASLKSDLISSDKLHRKRRTQEAARPLTSAEVAIGLCGKRFTLTYQMWMPDENEIFGVELEEDYDASERFESEDNKHQGILHELHDILPKRLAAARLEEEERFASVFLAAQSSFRSTCSNRVRQGCHEIFGTGTSALMTDNNEHQTLLDLLGYDADEKTYQLFPPLLYEDPNTCKKGTVFLNEAIIKALQSCLFGPSTIKQDKAPSTTTKSNAKIWGLKVVTPGMIAGAAVLARWAISRDASFQAVGALTGFNYAEAFDCYKKYIIVALERNTPSGRRLLAVYNKRLFPHKVSEPENQSGAQLHTEMDDMMADLLAEEPEGTGGTAGDVQREASPARAQSTAAGPDTNSGVGLPPREGDLEAQLADSLRDLQEEDAGPVRHQGAVQQQTASQPRTSAPMASTSAGSQNQGSRSASQHSRGTRSRSPPACGTKRRQGASTQQTSSEKPAKKKKTSGGAPARQTPRAPSTRRMK